MRVKAISFAEDREFQQQHAADVEAARKPAPRGIRVHAESKAGSSKQDLRHKIGRLVEKALRVVSREDEAEMLWTRTDYNSLRVSCLYHVALRGYPYDTVGFDAPSRIGSRAHLELLYAGWREGTIFFERMTRAELEQLADDECTLVDQLALKALRIDVGKRRMREPRTRSKFLGANKKNVKSARRTDCWEDEPLAKRLRIR